MKKLCVLLSLLALPCLLSAQQKEAHLWGTVTVDSLQKAPYDVWFKKNYADYKPTPSVIEALKALKINDFKIKIFFGTWCGDTKREMPRLLKVLDAIGFPKEKITFIALSSADSIYKQSDKGEERGYNIFRVGCYVIEKNGVEVNRITEFPILSMERDLLAIFSNQNYTPQYPAYVTIGQWLKDGTLAEDNISPQSLATQLRSKVGSMSDLNACGYVLMREGKLKEALKIFRINANLFPENSNVWHSLAEGWLTFGDREKALTALEYGLKLNKEPEFSKSFLALQKQILETKSK
jgi:tetratricopeptide (TPR) repeat protein